MPVRALFVSTILLSAFLLFLIQPMLTKILLPLLGGSPAVWQTAMMFYQALLLGGYLYAHTATRYWGTKKQSRLHIVLLLLSCACLPIQLSSVDAFSPTEAPIGFLLVSLLLTIGAPFFILSANAPLLQHWYACHRATESDNPFALYSASNLGSFTALLAYPFAIEWLLPLSTQTALWSGLYAVFTMLLILCVAQINRHFAHETPMDSDGDAATEDAASPTPVQKLRWVALAFIPSSLMLGLTTYMTTDIAAAPLLWIIPLALYLATYVLAFHPRMPGYRFFLSEQPIIISLLMIGMATQLDAVTPFQAIHFIAFFAIAMVCHGQLALCRPQARHLTGFYVWVSVGGACGGVFNALIAPALFTHADEYWLVLVLGCFLRPKTEKAAREKRERVLDLLLPLTLAAVLILQYHGAALIERFVPEIIDRLQALRTELFMGRPVPESDAITACFIVLAGILLPKYCQHRPLRFGCAALVIFIAIPFAQSAKKDVIIYTERNFFGIITITERADPPLHFLEHGTTLHGIQSLEEDKRLALTTYYIHVRDIFRRLPDETRLKPVALGGLGAGTLACLGEEQQEFNFFEIDEAVKYIAQNPEFFTYLRDCSTRSTVTIADARIGMQGAADGHYGAIFMDAYSSDALPMHLLTLEALNIYARKLAPGGIIAFNISNRYLRLSQVLANLAQAAGMVAIERVAASKEANTTAAHWVVMARHWEDLAPLGYEKDGWRPMKANNDTLWTDDYSNLLSVLR